MVKLKHDKELYIHNKNRDAIKNWLLNPPTKHHELLFKMIGFVPEVGVPFYESFTHHFCDKCFPLCSSCLSDLQIKDDYANMYTFYMLLEALSRFLVPSDKIKKYKIHLKKVEMEKDFATN